MQKHVVQSLLTLVIMSLCEILIYISRFNKIKSAGYCYSMLINVSNETDTLFSTEE